MQICVTQGRQITSPHRVTFLEFYQTATRLPVVNLKNPYFW